MEPRVADLERHVQYLLKRVFALEQTVARLEDKARKEERHMEGTFMDHPAYLCGDWCKEK